MEIHYTLEKDDYLNFNLKQLSTDEKIKRAMASQIFIPVLVILALVAWYWYKDQLSPLRIGVFLFLLVAWPLLYLKLFKYTITKRLKSIIDQRAKELNLGERTLYIDEKGIKDQYGNLPFTHLHHIEEGKNYYFFHETREAAYILPKRDLSQEELDYISSILLKLKEQIIQEN